MTATDKTLGLAYDYADAMDDAVSQYDEGSITWDVFSRRIDAIHAEASRKGALDMALEVRAARFAERFA